MTKPPLSPHLQIYKLPLNALLSISHRITGIVLMFALLSLIFVLAILAMGEESFASVDPLLSSWMFKGVIYLTVLTLIYHLCNGIRHLLWDRLIGLGKQQSYWSSVAVLIITASIFTGWIALL